MDARMPFVLLSGALFGAGLALSTMVQPEVVLGFLRWDDMGLLLVLGGAFFVTLLAYRFGPRLLSRPIAGRAFGAHAATLDRRTVLGSALFGVGWGTCGVCPAPALAGLGIGSWSLALAVVGLFAGAYVQGRFASGAK